MKSILSIVIVNWNTAEYLKVCLQSIRKNLEKGRILIYVVDNASKDDSVRMIKEIFPWVKLITNTENVGFAKANNQVLKKVSTDYILILNPDTRLTKGSLSKLVDYLSSHPQVAACGPMLLNPNGSIQKKGYYHRLPSLLQAFLFYTEASRLSFKSKFLVKKYWEDELSINHSQEIEQIPGACLLIRNEVLKEVNYFDEDYTLWFEDVDLCFKIKRLGYQLMFIPAIIVFHVGGASFEKWTDDVAKQIRFLKSLFIFFDKHKNYLSRFLIRVIIICNLIYLILTKSVKQIITPANHRKEFIKNKWEAVKCLLA